MTASLKSRFPALQDFSLTSPRTSLYNCIAWAAGTDRRWWWPSPDYYWPREGLTDSSVVEFVAAFGTLGYEPCVDGALEDDFEKVVIYVLSTEVQHMARQLRTGRWTSKIGQLEDIEHGSPTELEGSDYGTVVQYMRRAFSA